MPKGTQSRIVASYIALPVGVLSDIGRRYSYRICVPSREDRGRGGVTVGGVERDTGGAFGVDGEDSSNFFPDSDGTDGVFLWCSDD